MVKSNNSTVTVNPGAVASVTLAPATDTVSSGSSVTFTATAFDASNNPVGGVQLYGFLNGDTTPIVGLTIPPTSTGAGGTAAGQTTFTINFTTAGTQVIDVATDQTNT